MSLFKYVTSASHTNEPQQQNKTQNYKRVATRASAPSEEYIDGSRGFCYLHYLHFPHEPPPHKSKRQFRTETHKQAAKSENSYSRSACLSVHLPSSQMFSALLRSSTTRDSAWAAPISVARLHQDWLSVEPSATWHESLRVAGPRAQRGGNGNRSAFSLTALQ